MIALAVPSGTIMRRLPLLAVLRWAVLTGYALLVALGHGGWHVAIEHNACPAHGSHALGAQAKAEHSHSTCSHSHKHKHSAKHSHASHSHEEPGEHSPTPHAPHEPEHCSVCAVFSAPLTLASVVELVISVTEVNSRVEWQALLVPVSQESLPTVRGPPAC